MDDRCFLSRFGKAKFSQPILLGALDYRNKRVFIGPLFWPSGDAAADLKEILAFYRSFVPKKPEYAFHGD